MNNDNDEQVHIDDFVEYVNEQTITRLPDTLMGKNFKEKNRVKNVFDTKNYLAQSDTERQIVNDAEELLKLAEVNLPTGKCQNRLKSQPHHPNCFNQYKFHQFCYLIGNLYKT